MSRTQRDSSSIEPSHDGYSCIGHIHFWERAITSRRQFIGAAAGTTSAALTLELPISVLAQARGYGATSKSGFGFTSLRTPASDRLSWLADFDRDGKTNFAVWRPSHWSRHNMAPPQVSFEQILVLQEHEMKETPAPPQTGA